MPYDMTKFGQVCLGFRTCWKTFFLAGMVFHLAARFSAKIIVSAETERFWGSIPLGPKLPWPDVKPFWEHCVC